MCTAVEELCVQVWEEEVRSIPNPTPAAANEEKAPEAAAPPASKKKGGKKGGKKKKGSVAAVVEADGEGGDANKDVVWVPTGTPPRLLAEAQLSLTQLAAPTLQTKVRPRWSCGVGCVALPVVCADTWVICFCRPFGVSSHPIHVCCFVCTSALFLSVVFFFFFFAAVCFCLVGSFVRSFVRRAHTQALTESPLLTWHDLPSSVLRTAREAARRTLVARHLAEVAAAEAALSEEERKAAEAAAAAAEEQGEEEAPAFAPEEAALQEATARVTGTVLDALRQCQARAAKQRAREAALRRQGLLDGDVVGTGGDGAGGAGEGEGGGGGDGGSASPQVASVAVRVELRVDESEFVASGSVDQAKS